jgi:hypothetical protein
MGAALSIRLASGLRASGLDPSLVTQLLDPLSTPQSVADAGIRLAMANAIHLVFLIAFAAAALGLVAAFLTPHRDLEERLPVATESDPTLISAD